MIEADPRGTTKKLFARAYPPRPSPRTLSARGSSQVREERFIAVIADPGAFKEMDKTWPMYGKHADPPLTPEKWWTELIRRSIVNAGAEPSLVDHALPRLGPSLLKRFESEAGYRNFPETLDTRACVSSMRVECKAPSTKCSGRARSAGRQGIGRV